MRAKNFGGEAPKTFAESIGGKTRVVRARNKISEEKKSAQSDPTDPENEINIAAKHQTSKSANLEMINHRLHQERQLLRYLEKHCDQHHGTQVPASTSTISVSRPDQRTTRFYHHGYDYHGKHSTPPEHPDHHTNGEEKRQPRSDQEQDQHHQVRRLNPTQHHRDTGETAH